MVGRGHHGLSVAYEGNRLYKRLGAMRPGILVIDEAGYLRLDSLPANMCFQM
jgi:hypothetical protein